MIDDYIETHGIDPTPLLEETDWMSEYISGEDTDDEEKKTEMYEQLANAAGLSAEEKEAGVKVWQKLLCVFRSDEVCLRSDVL